MFPFRQAIDQKIRDRKIDGALFEDAVKHVEQVLRNDPYVRFLQSKEYTELLSHNSASLD